MQFSLFQPQKIDPLRYRENWGLETAPKGSKVQLKHSSGLDWHLVWINCPDKENVLAGWQRSKNELLKLADLRGWVVCK